MNTIYHGDCLDVMRTFSSESVDLIATDPPFNTGRDFVGANGGFSDKWTDYTPEPLTGVQKEVVELAAKTHSKGLSNFLCFMAVRIQEMYRVLKDTGSMYLHCDPKASHYLKLLLDATFGATHFRNEIAWCYSQGGRSKKDFPKKHDIILRYTRSKRYVFNGEDIRIPYELISPTSVDSFTKRDENGRYYKEIRGSKNDKMYRYYKDEGKLPLDWWIDIPQITGHAATSNKTERVGWPTEKPLKLYQRIIKASSNEGDIVLDPFCGSGTTCLAATKLGRKYVGIDVSEDAVSLSRKSLSTPADMFTDSPQECTGSLLTASN